MTSRSNPVGLGILGAMLVLGACTGGDDSATNPTSTVAEPTSQVSEVTGTDVESTTTSTSPSTTAVIEESGTTTTRNTAEPPVTVAADPNGYSQATGYVIGVIDSDEYRVLAVDIETGEETELYSTLAEATYYSRPVLEADGSGAYLSESGEDYWFSCTSSLPRLTRLDFETGALETIGRGAYAQPSPDGNRLAYLTASDCLPDPADPANWVVTPLDTVVVRDIGTGVEVRYTDPTVLERFSDAGAEAPLFDVELSGVAWTSGGHLIAGDLRLMVDSTIEVVNRTTNVLGHYGRVVGYDPNHGLILTEREVDERTSELMALDEVQLDEVGVQGTATPSAEFLFGLFALDIGSQALVDIDNGILNAPDLAEIELPDGFHQIDW